LLPWHPSRHSGGKPDGLHLPVLPLSRAAMIRMLPGISKLIVMSVAEDILKIEFAED
jgi:hypothetical protein